jgi:hypothetical protein
MTITTSERARLAAILGMLGSDHAGERAAAGLHAEAFRKKHRLTWAELLALQPEPEPPRYEPPPPPPPPEPVWAPIYVPATNDLAKGRFTSVILGGLLAGVVLIIARQMLFSPF